LGNSLVYKVDVVEGSDTGHFQIKSILVDNLRDIHSCPDRLDNNLVGIGLEGRDKHSRFLWDSNLLDTLEVLEGLEDSMLDISHSLVCKDQSMMTRHEPPPTLIPV